MLRSLRAFVAPVISTAIATAGLVGLAGASVAATSHSAPSSVCAGVSNCQLVAQADVLGDGRLDQIGWRQLSTEVAQVRVLSPSGQMLTRNVDVHFWPGGGAWGGVARVDQVAGVELLIGSEQGAHTPMYTMLTARDGALVVEHSPSPLSWRWQVDAAYGDIMGWARHTLSDGRIAMTQRIAFRSANGVTFSGHSVTYAWGSGRWSRVSRATTHYSNEGAANAAAGFHVPGLARFPGLA